MKKILGTCFQREFMVKSKIDFFASVNLKTLALEGSPEKM
jgi:hypothetical protein